MPTLTEHEASWKTAIIGLKSGYIEVNAQPVWSQLPASFISYGHAYAKMGRFVCFLDPFLGLFCHFLARWSQIKVLELMGKLGPSVWEIFKKWRKNFLDFSMIFSKKQA